MATLYPEVERLRVARDRLVRLRTKVEMSPPPPEDLPRSREWVARETLAHIDEMLPYWMGAWTSTWSGQSGGCSSSTIGSAPVADQTGNGAT